MKLILNKRIKRNIRNNRAFYIGSIILCIITVAFIIACTSTGITMTYSVEQFYEEYNVEDAQFMTMQPIDQASMEALENKYGVQIEEMKYVEVDINNTTLRVFCENKKINLSQIKSGEDFSREASILISNDYAAENDMSQGSTIQIGQDNYVINGYYTRPDYIYMLKSISDLYINNKIFGIGLLEEDNFNKLQNIQSYYSVVYSMNNTVEFREEINTQFRMLYYYDHGTNTRIKHGLEQGKAVSGMALAFTPILFALNMGFIAVALSRMVKKDRRNIGIIVAFGYKKKEVVLHYIKYALITAVSGCILGVAAGFLLVQPFINLYCSEFNFPIVLQHYDLASIGSSVIFPIILFSLTSAAVAYSMVKKPTVELLKGNMKDSKKKTSTLFAKSRLKKHLKYGIRTAMRNKGRSAVFVFGIFIASLLIIIGLVLNTSCQHLIKTQLDNSTKYKYAYNFVQLQTDKEYGEGQKFIQGTYELKDSGIAILLIGTEFNLQSDYYSLSTEDGEELKKDGVYIGRALAELLGVGTGDTLEFINPVTLEEYKVELAGVASNRTQKVIFMTLENTNKLLGNASNTYSGIFSNEKLEIDENLLSLVQKSTEIEEAFKRVLEPMMGVIYILVFLGIVLGMIVIYIITDMIIDENTNQISMLKVLGYKMKEITKMVLNINYFLVFIGYLIAIPIALLFCDIALKSNIESLSVYIEVRFSFLDFILSLLLVYITYFITVKLVKRKIAKVDMVQSLKDNRE